MCMGELHEDVYFGDANKRYLELAEMTKENWNTEGSSDNSILKKYLSHTYRKLQEEGKVIFESKYGIFNTGLFTEFYEPIYVYMEPNTAGGEQKFYLKGFMSSYDLGELGIGNLPDRANYFENPELLIFDAKCKINVQFEHILSDEENITRLPETIRDAKNLQSILIGAIDTMKKRVLANYKIAVPQYYKGKIQLLLPLCLVDSDIPDLALVVTKNPTGNFYQGHTCLSIEMAYNNARLIAKPDSYWLKI